MLSPREQHPARSVGRVAHGLRVGAAAAVREFRRERTEHRVGRPAQPDRPAMPLPRRNWRTRVVEALVVLGIVLLALVAMGTLELLPSSALVDARLASSGVFFVVGGFLVLRARRVRPLLRAQHAVSVLHAMNRWRTRAFERLADIVGRVMLLAGAFELALALARLV